MFTVVHVYFHPCWVETKSEAWFHDRASQAMPCAEKYHWIPEERLMSIAISLSSSMDEIDGGAVDRLINSFKIDEA